jgi:lipopolysaccharide transport system permease protein
MSHQYTETLITPQKKLLSLNLAAIWAYRDLVGLLVRRDFVANYKQTVLGPTWFVLQPLFTTIIFVVIFAKLGNLSTDGLPPMLFYMSGITFWNYFADCLKKNSSTFIDNKGVFGKVYFPRLIIPISVTISNLLRLGIQFALFMGIYLYFVFTGAEMAVNGWVLLLPLNIVLLGLLGLGLGILISSLTTKYRDLRYMIDFAVQMAMYATIIFPLSAYPERFQWLALINPLIPLIETTKLGLLGSGYFDLNTYLYCIGFTLVSLIIGILIFNKTEQNFMDVV